MAKKLFQAAAAATDGPPAPGVPPVADQAARMAEAVVETGRSTAAGAAAEDVAGSAREAPGIGSGAVGATVPADIVADRGAAVGYLGVSDRAELVQLIRDIVRVEMSGHVGAGLRGLEPLGTLDRAALDADQYDLEITSRVDGFRRAGLAHPSAPTPRRSRDFTPAQLDQLREEPNLIVRRLSPSRP